MDPKTFIGWKAAAMPLAATALALGMGAAYFSGSSTQEPPPSDDSMVRVRFEQPTPVYSPAARMPAGASLQQASSIDIFRKANYSLDAAPAPAASAKRTPAKGKGGSVSDFSQQEAQDITSGKMEEMLGDMAGQAAAAASGQVMAGAGMASSVGMNRASRGESLQAGGGGPQARRSAAQAAAANMDSARRTVAMANRTFTGAVSTLSGGGTTGANGAKADGIGGAAKSPAGGAQLAPGGGNPFGGGAPSIMGDFGNGPTGGAGAGAGGGGMPLGAASGGPMSSAWNYVVDFGSVYAYETALRQVILMNTGGGVLKVNAVERIGGSDTFSVVSDKCTGATVPAGRNCLIRIRYAPRGAAQNSAAFEFRTGSGQATEVIPIHVTADSRAPGPYSKFSQRAGEGYLNRVELGEVPEGYSMEQKMRIANTSNREWKNIRIMAADLPYNIRTTMDNCTARNLAPGQSCEVTVKFTPTSDVTKPLCGVQYGQYQAVDTGTGAKSVQARPRHPQFIVKGPVEGKLQGSYKVIATVKSHTWWGQEETNVLNFTVTARTSAPFPVAGLVRISEGFYFK